MSYILYLDGKLIELSDSKPVAQTKQVNDIARLDNRQTNYTNKFIVPLTAKNIRTVEQVYLNGNYSDFPYRKINADLFDGETGECLIYKGWANLGKTTDKGYEIYVYDGYIDFYRSIENKTLTDIDITPLNHLKNLQTVINSFTMNLPYKYVLGDYNGKNLDNIGATLLDINIDYQVPSARNTFIWDRIFEFIGWTYSGSVFDTDEFKNLLMTFPKPVPQSVPITTLMTSQYTQIGINTTQEPGPTPGSLEYVNSYYAIMFPNSFSSPFGTHLSNTGYISITVSGSYIIKASGSFCNVLSGCSSVLDWQVRSSSNALVSFGSFDSAVDSYTIITVNAGQKVFISTPITGQTSSYVNNPMSGGMQISFEHVDGFDANFSEVLVDFKVTEYINEIMQRFCLTAFKDKYSNHMTFLTLKEIIENEAEDWSKFSPKKKGEAYIYGQYAKRNLFKHRYNEENEKHHDGYIKITNENLKDETTVINSRIYAPDKGQGHLGGFRGTFRMWTKEIKDDGTVNYKDLSGRYYFLRSKDFSRTTIIGSKVLNTFQTVNDIPCVNYDGLPFDKIIDNHYPYMNTLLNKAKTLDVDFHLTSNKVANFDFKRCIYIEQFGSYYIVNKIKGFVKDKVTTCEIIEVDKDQAAFINPPPPTTILTLIDFSIVSCQLLINVTTNIVQPATVFIQFEIPPIVPGTPGINNSIQGTLNNNVITVDLANLPASFPFSYNMYAIYFNPFFVQYNSNALPIAINSDCYIGVGFINVLSYTRNPGEDMIVNIDTDIPFPFTVSLQGSRIYPTFDFFFPISIIATSTSLHFPGVPAGVWQYQLQSGSVMSNQF